MSNNPQQIRADIERQRRDLSRNIDNLGEQVRPGNVARRQTRKVTGRFSDLRDRIFGTDEADDYYRYGTYGYEGDYGVRPERGDNQNDEQGRVQQGVEQGKQALAEYGDQGRAALHQAGEAVRNSPEMARRGTRGNPLAAGLIAFGVGLLAGSVLPTSQQEQRLAGELKDRAEPLVDGAKEEARRMGENLRPAAEDAAAQLKSTATEAVGNVRNEGESAAQDVKGSAQDAQSNVRDQAQS